jgi:Family of unknown function (DUF6343)/Protein of unknown function (DUF3099)
MVRSGDEPAHARSPERLRLGLALVGVAVSLAVGALFLRDRVVWGMALCAAGALASALDAVLAVRRIRQGPHFQPGHDIPPYRPVSPERPPQPLRPAVTQRTRQRRYFALMGTCLGLLLVAWVGVRPYSTTITVALTVVAMVIPPIAALVANAGWWRGGPPDPPSGAAPRD